MKKNVGSTDAIIRIISGQLILSTTTLVYLGPQTKLAYFGLIGLIIMFTGLVGYCHPYTMMGIDTTDSKEDK